jgi:hypothetical protein
MEIFSERFVAIPLIKQRCACKQPTEILVHTKNSALDTAAFAHLPSRLSSPPIRQHLQIPHPSDTLFRFIFQYITQPQQLMSISLAL